jgi:PAS domain S-box-containing protein
MVTYILACSVLLQLTAAVMAFRLIRLTGSRTAWGLIAVALALMSVRSAIPLYRLLSGDSAVAPDLLHELIGLALSLLMALGVAGTAPLFSAIGRSHKALRESEYFFKESQRAAFVGSYKTDFTTGFWESSEVLDRIFGIDRNYSRNVQGWLDIVHPDDMEMMDRYLREEVISKRKPFNKEYRIIRKSDGEIRWVNGLGEVAFDIEGNVISLIGTIQDITDRKRAEVALQESERRLSSIYDTVGDVIFHLAVEADGSYRFVSINQAFRNVTGLSEEMVVGKLVHDVIPEPSLSMVLGKYRQAIEENSIIRWEETSDYPTGRLTGDVSIAPVADDGGRCTHLVGSVHDVTERKRAEMEIHQLNEELEKRVIDRTAQLQAANKELEAFSYSVSHDLRAPLRALDGFSRILIEDYAAQLPDKAVGHLNRVRNGAVQMGRLIDDLLRFSRLSRQPLEKQSVNLSALVEETWSALESEREGRQVELVMGFLPNCQGDPSLLKQVFFNLLSNALKYSRRTADARIEIGCLPQVIRAGEPPATNVYFVKDNGVGFDMQFAGKLFGVFQRLHRPDEYEGTGVGLAIVHSIIARHGGKIWAESEPDKGTTFYLTIGDTQVATAPTAEKAMV